jgi:hypothetical protein
MDGPVSQSRRNTYGNILYLKKGDECYIGQNITSQRVIILNVKGIFHQQEVDKCKD